MKRGYAGDYVPLLPVMLAGATEDQGEGSAIPAEPQHTPTDPVSSTSQPIIPSTNEPLPQPSPPSNLTDRILRFLSLRGATTTTSGLDAGLDSGNIHETPLRSHEAPLYKELYQTKTTYGKAVLTLVERVKSLEVALKRKTKKVVVSDSEDEETENQGRKIQDIDDDPLVSLVRESMKEKDTDFKAKSTDKGIRYKRKTRSKSIEKDISTNLDADIRVNPGSEDFNTGNEDFNTSSLGVSIGSRPVSTPSVVQTKNVTIPSPIKSQREGKDPMNTEEIQATKRTKAQIQQEEAGLVEAMRLQALQEEEAARQVHLDALLAKRIEKKS
ncbi:hypothetical protein Tco_1566288 [Tanacetum coccineum]